MNDADDRRKSVSPDLEEITHRARYDGLTDIYNRITLEEIINNYFSDSNRHFGTFIMLDVDNFKRVNDEYGHIKGDKVLIEVAETLKRYFRKSDSVARVGGDEFAIFVPLRFTEEELQERLDGICRNLRIRVRDLELTCSVGACCAPEFGLNFDTLYNNADIALLAAKRFGKNQYQIYSEELELPSHVLYRNMDWLLDESTDALMVCDVNDYSVLYLNKVACELAGMPKRECINHPCYKVLWGKSEPCAHCVPLELMTHEFCKHSATNDDGRHLLIKGKLVDWGGTLARIQYIQDNTEKTKLLHDLIQVSNDRKRILDLLPGGLFRYAADGPGEFDFISENTYEMLGYTREEFIEKFDNRFENMVWHQDRDRVLKEIDEQVIEADNDQCDYRIECKDGSLCWVHDAGHLVEDAEGKRWFYVTIVGYTDKEIEQVEHSQQADGEMGASARSADEKGEQSQFVRFY